MFKVGDKVRRTKEEHGGMTIGDTAVVTDIKDKGDSIQLNKYCKDKFWWHESRNFELVEQSKDWKIKEDALMDCMKIMIGNPLTHFNIIKPTGRNHMSNIIKFAKNLVLSGDEKLLRQQGLKDEFGEYTEDAIQIVIQKLVKDNEPELIKIAQAKKDEESKK